MFKRVATFGFYTIISRILGAIRDALLAIFIGANGVGDAFFLAFRLPNLFRAFFAEGAFSIAFIPIYAPKLSHDRLGAAVFATQIFSILFFLLAFFCFLLSFSSPVIFKFFAPGFVDKDSFGLAVNLSHIVLPYLLFISLAALIGGMLQAHGHFAATAAAPIILNICLIVAIFIPSSFGIAERLAVAVFVSGVLQFLLLLVVSSSYKIDFSLTGKFVFNDDIGIFAKRVIPAMLTGCITQISVWVDTAFASTITHGVSYIYYSDRISQLPQAVIGTAIGIVLLPLISKKIHEKDHQGAIAEQNRALAIGMIFVIPTTLAFALVSDSIVSAIFGYGSFMYHDVLKVSEILRVLVFSLPAILVAKVMLPVFYASGRNKTSVIIALFALTINILLNIVLMNKYQCIGIAIATVASSWVNAMLLVFVLRREGLFKIEKHLSKSITLASYSVAIMTVFVFLCNAFLHNLLLYGNWITRLTSLFILGVVGAISYFGPLYFFQGKSWMPKNSIGVTIGGECKSFDAL